MQTLESYLFELRKLLRATSRKTSSPRTSRARETEDLVIRPSDSQRRGRVVRGDNRGAETPTTMTDSGEMEDDGMGGCEYFSFFSIIVPVSRSEANPHISRWFLRCRNASTRTKRRERRTRPERQAR